MAGVALDVQNPIGLGNFDERTCHYFLSFNLSWKDIAALVGVSYDSIRQWASRRNIRKYTQLTDEWEQRIRAYIREKKQYDWGYRTISAEFHAEHQVRFGEKRWQELVSEEDPEGMQQTYLNCLIFGIRSHWTHLCPASEYCVGVLEVPLATVMLHILFCFAWQVLSVAVREGYAV
jgi:hypothetical protein